MDGQSDGESSEEEEEEQHALRREVRVYYSRWSGIRVRYKWLQYVQRMKRESERRAKKRESEGEKKERKREERPVPMADRVNFSL